MTENRNGYGLLSNEGNMRLIRLAVGVMAIGAAWGSVQTSIWRTEREIVIIRQEILADYRPLARVTAVQTIEIASLMRQLDTLDKKLDNLEVRIRQLEQRRPQ